MTEPTESQDLETKAAELKAILINKSKRDAREYLKTFTPEEVRWIERHPYYKTYYKATLLSC